MKFFACIIVLDKKAQKQMKKLAYKNGNNAIRIKQVIKRYKHQKISLIV